MKQKIMLTKGDVENLLILKSLWVCLGGDSTSPVKIKK